MNEGARGKEVRDSSSTATCTEIERGGGIMMMTAPKGGSKGKLTSSGMSECSVPALLCAFTFFSWP
jgi:hypothetical protein